MVRLFENKDTYDLTCQRIADLLNFESGNNFNECTYRKKWVSFSRGREYERNSCYDKNVAIQVQELKKEKVKLFDERTEFNKQIRNQARFEDRLNKLESALTSKGIVEFKTNKIPSINSDNDLIVCLSDLHIGATYNTPFGQYDSEIARGRLEEYLSCIIEIQQKHNSEKCFVSLLGDMISGSIHLDTQVSNRENVIEQVKLVSELVSNFVYELSKHFNMVYLSSVNGNHSRITSKQDALKDERLDELVPWFVKFTLTHIKNIHVIETKIDSTISVMTIRDKIYVGVHGDFDNFNVTGVSKLVMMLGFKPYAILFGHKHQCAYGDVAGIKMIQSGSLGACGDEFTIQKRIYGEANQMVCICNSYGIQACYPVPLN